MKTNFSRVFALLALMLFAASCTDHEVPEPQLVPAKIKTLPLKHGTPIATFYVQFEDLGNIPITEYGVVMSTGVSGYLVPLPTLADEVLIFTEAAEIWTRRHRRKTRHLQTQITALMPS